MKVNYIIHYEFFVSTFVHTGKNELIILSNFIDQKISKDVGTEYFEEILVDNDRGKIIKKKQ